MGKGSGQVIKNSPGKTTVLPGEFEKGSGYNYDCEVGTALSLVP
jgi:hypothetical protein